MVHGFTASPTELRTLGDYLHQAGFSIQGVRTAGHGTNLDDLGKCTRRDWYASVEAGYRELSEHCQHIVAIGLSMGALLCCKLHQRTPAQRTRSTGPRIWYPLPLSLSRALAGQTAAPDRKIADESGLL